MQGTLKVTPEELSSASMEFFDGANNVRNYTCAMTELVDGISSIWSGNAQNAYVTKFHTLDDDIARMISMINEHVRDLNAMALEYSEAEDNSMELIQSLASDVIQ